VRFWLSLGFAIIMLSVVFCLHAESVLSRGIGDGGPATRATLFGPTGLAVDENNLYIVESMGKRVRRVNLKTGVITTIAGGGNQCPNEEYPLARSGCLGYPQRVAVDSHGNIYVTDEVSEGVIKVGIEAHSFSTVVAENVTLSSDSTFGKTVKLQWPVGIAIDPSGALFFDDYTVHTIYRWVLDDNSLEVVAGTGKEGFKGNGGPAKGAEFRFPEGLARDKNGNLFVADYGNCRIQRIDSKTGIVTTVTGTEESGSSCESLPDSGATLDQPTDVDVDQDGNVFFVQPWRGRVRRVDASTGSVSTVAGNGESGFSGDGGPATEAQFHNPEGIAVDKTGKLYISDSDNGRVRRVDMKTGTITTVAGKGPVLPDLIL
jgi:trimeric autotransporter adhesin